MKKALKIVAITFAALIALTGAYLIYVMKSVDPATLPENHGKVVSKLYLSEEGKPVTPRDAKRPLIVGFGGAEGGNAWTRPRAAAMRNRFLNEGYAFLAVGYFGIEGTPRQLDRIALEGVYQAIEAAAKDPAVEGRCIAVIGGSKGGELALLLASRYPQIKAVAGLSTGNSVFVAVTEALNTSSFSHRGEQIPFVPFPWAATWPLITGDKRKVFDLMSADKAAVERALIPVERINGPVFLMSGRRDEMWAATEMSDAMMARLRDKKFPHAYEHIALEGGHDAPLKQMNRVLDYFNTHFKPGLENGCARG